MIDISDVKVQEFENGIAIIPESDTKKVMIPSPPSTQVVFINPRPCVIYITDGTVNDMLKAYCKENKVVFIIPAKQEAADVVKAYDWANKNKSKINIKKGAFSVKADKAYMDFAAEAVEEIEDFDYDVELDEVEEFSL